MLLWVKTAAGKSTLMKCLFGIYNKDSGQYLSGRNEINFKNSKEALEHGVAMDAIKEAESGVKAQCNG